ncbi:MAG: hypothetical protein LBG59_06300 [Candidatus Peribacteria bacterium]|jgi:hypothetical protein|nr:hypothetical protein [Candidatus Peribacteria bacterium]
MPTSNLCFAGSGSAVVSGANGWTWKCKGINGGFDVDCFSQKIVYSCQGTIPNNAEFCSGSDQGLTTMTHTQIVSNCGEYKCAYTCKSGYTQEGDTCSVRSTSRYP